MTRQWTDCLTFRSSTTLLSKTAGSITLRFQEEAFFERMADSGSEEIEITDLVHKFMAVTGAEDTVALSYLQQSGWNVDVCAVFFSKSVASPFSNKLNQNRCLCNFLIFQSAVNKFYDSCFARGGCGTKENPVVASKVFLIIN